MRLLLVLAAICFTEKQVWDAECNVSCRRSGYDHGECRTKAPDRCELCICGDALDYERQTEKRLIIPKRPKGRSVIEYYGPRDY